MLKGQNNKGYDLEERTYYFAKNCRDFVNLISKTLINIEYCKQLIRSSGSVAANYLEANQAISKKDFNLRIRICRKEAKESSLWLRLCIAGDKVKQKSLIIEAQEITKIFGAIVSKFK